MSTDTTTIKLPGTPRPWMNAVVTTLLRTPGARALLGRSLLVLTVTGARTGTRYSTPVQYVRDDGRLLVLSQRTRRWWRNIAEQPEVEVLLRGRTIRTQARLAEDDEAMAAIATFLRRQPRAASFYGIAVDAAGEPDPAGVAQLHELFVVIVIDVAAGRSSVS